MGIPSYFSYIIKNHANIIRNSYHIENVAKVRFHSLYMDCNSIIYDAVRALETKEAEANASADAPHLSFEERIVQSVITRIQHYVGVIRPTNVLYIAFDGVAPFAKMEQQRTRRYKTSYLATLDFENNRRLSSQELLEKKNAAWNTSAITPGTDFMELLSARVKRAFSDPLFLSRHRIQTVLVSTSQEPGEGEHKMFQYMREHTNKTETIAVYGLDSDLIMLSIFHHFYCYNIHIFRESPAFSKSLLPANMRVSDKDVLFLNIHKLSQHILQEMGCSTFSRRPIYDYVFLCFLLGNDFLPHFPALNLRTKGIYVLMDLYAKTIGAYSDRSFIDETTLRVRWRWLHLFISECAKMEHTLLLGEYTARAQMAKTAYSTKTAADRANVFENIPILLRAEELYICPEEQDWENRYYKIAFHQERTPEFVRTVCTRYLEGLEWVFKYYTQGCPHWRWKYPYHYAPLLCDLAKHIPLHETQYIHSNAGINRPFHPHIQLAYVIPRVQHSLLPSQIRNKLERFPKLFPDIETIQFQWIGCRYFWEAHALLPEIPIELLEQWEKEMV